MFTYSCTSLTYVKLDQIILGLLYSNPQMCLKSDKELLLFKIWEKMEESSEREKTKDGSHVLDVLYMCNRPEHRSRFKLWTIRKAERIINRLTGAT